jgi:hypothetical protein
MISNSALPISHVSRPIAGEVKQDDQKISNIIGKPIKFKTYYQSSFTLEDLLPTVQQAPKNTPGEFQIKCKLPNDMRIQIQIQISQLTQSPYLTILIIN